MPVRFSKHALERMEERDVTVAEVYRVFAYGRAERSYGGFRWTIDYNRVPNEHWKRILACLCVVASEDFEVITVFWNTYEHLVG